MKKIFATLSLFFLFSLLFTSVTDANTEWKTKNLGTKPNDYTVTVTLSQSINAQSLNSAAIYAENEWQQRVDIQTTVKDNELFIAPKTKYPNGATISIYINSNLLSTSKQALQKPTKIILHIDDLQKEFEPRQDALNDVVFSKPVTQVKSSQIISIDDTLSSATLKNVAAQLLQNQVLYFPKSESFPFGAYRTVDKVTADNGAFTLQLAQPSMQTFIKKLDISDHIAINATTFTVNPALRNNGTVLVTNRDSRFLSNALAATALPTMQKFLTIEVHKNGIEATFNEFSIFNGAATVSGTAAISDLQAAIDIDEQFTLNKLQLSYQEDVQLQTTLKQAQAFGTSKEIYLGQIPIPYLGAKGIGLNAFVYLTIDIAGNSKLSVTYSPSFNVSIDYPNAQQQFLAIKPDAGIDKLAIDVESGAQMSLAATVGLGLLIGDHRLLELNGKLESSISATGKPFVDYKQFTNSAFCISNNLKVRTNVNLQFDIVFASERIILANKDLLSLSQGNCEFKSIELIAPSTALVAGQKEKWTAVGHFAFTNDRIVIPTPSSVVSFTSDNRYVTVSNKGDIHVSEDVPTKQQATITLTVKNPVTNEQQRVKKELSIAPVTNFSQGNGYLQGQYAAKAWQPTLANWSKNSITTGPKQLTKTNGTFFSQLTSLPVIDAQQNMYSIGSQQKSIVALTKQGKQLWEVKFKETVGYPTLANSNTLYVAASNRVYALQMTTGKTLWSTPLDGTIASDVSTAHHISLQADGTLLVPTSTKLYAINPSGAVKWSKPVKGAFLGEAATHISTNTTIYYATQETLYAYNEYGGKLWERNFVNQSLAVEAMTIAPNGNPYICMTNGQLLEIGSKGETLQSKKLAQCNAVVVSADNTIYVATNTEVISFSQQFKQLQQYTFSDRYERDYLTFEQLIIDAQQNVYVSGVAGATLGSMTTYYVALNKSLKELMLVNGAGLDAAMLIQPNAFYTMIDTPNYGEPYLMKYTY